jgi:response regulator of citrate/malate metabolism
MYRVIIVDDEPEIARGTKSYVEKNPDFQAKAIFSDGQEALNYIWLNPVDLIILDLYMPKMNGKEFLYRLRRENIQVDVIVVTAANDAENIREVMPFGVVDYLLKPFSADRFAEALERFVQRHRTINAISGLDQKGIDTMFQSPSDDRREREYVSRLEQKGLQVGPYETLAHFLRQHEGESFSAEQLAKVAQLSKVTTRRYLNEMIESRQVVREVDISSDSQPAMMYHWREGAGE